MVSTYYDINMEYFGMEAVVEPNQKFKIAGTLINHDLIFFPQ